MRSVLYNVECGRESGGARIDNIKERSTLKKQTLLVLIPVYTQPKLGSGKPV